METDFAKTSLAFLCNSLFIIHKWLLSYGQIPILSTRKIEALLNQLGVGNHDKRTVSRICSSLDKHIQALRARRIDSEVRYLFLDATYIKVRQNYRIVSHAVFIAVGIDAEGTRRILDVMVSACADHASWEVFLCGLVDRGLRGVQMVTSDAHRGLQAAIQGTFVGSSWQRCTIHVMRNLLSHVSHRDKRATAALARTVLAQPTIADAQRQLAAVLSELERRWGKKPAAVLMDAEDSFFAHGVPGCASSAHSHIQHGGARKPGDQATNKGRVCFP